MCHTQHVLLGDQDLGKLRNLVLSHNNINGFNCKNNALIAFRPYMPCSSMHVAGLEILCYTQVSFTPVAKQGQSTFLTNYFLYTSLECGYMTLLGTINLDSFRPQEAKVS